MNVKWICLTILVVISCAVVASADLAFGENKMYMGELPNKGIYFFKVEQVPRSVTVYWDYHSDKIADRAFVCPMVDSGLVRDCSIEYPFDAGDPDTYIFSTCPNSSDPTYYLTTRECWECKTCMYFLIPDKALHPFSVNNAFNTKLCNTN